MIQFQHVYVTYRSSGRETLTDFSLNVKPGEFVVLTGKSGCGKTTVTRLINSLIPNFFDADLRGEVLVGGLDIKTASIREIARRVGSVFQDPRSQFFTLQVLSELAFPSENYGIEPPIMQQQIQKAVQDFNLGGLLTRSLFALSSGEKQKVAVASVYALKPQIYVFDEPSANLDNGGAAQLLAVLKTLQAQGHTIVIAEHRLGYLQGLVDRVILMEGGQAAEQFSGDDFFAQPPLWLRKRGLRRLAGPDRRPAVKEQVSRAAAAKTPFLEAVNVFFGYKKGTVVLNGISLCAHRGEVIGIMGANGTGKSTLLRVLMGLEKAARGQILIDGVPSGRRARRRQSFYVMQDVDYQLFAPSVREELLLGGGASAATVAKAEAYLRFFQLEGDKTAHPAALSGGQKQRLAIAVACMRNAGLLFLDEPTSGLDGENMEKVSRMIRRLAGEGRCVVVITHDAEFAAATFDQIYHLSEGGHLSNRPLQEYLYSKEQEELS